MSDETKVPLETAIERHRKWNAWVREERARGFKGILWPYEECTEDAVRIARAYVEGETPEGKEAARLKQVIRDIASFAAAHHDQEGSHHWLHALAVDIPAMCERALEETARPDEQTCDVQPEEDLNF